MSVSEKVSTTMLWVKQLSSGTLIDVSRRLLAFRFFQRNFKPFLVCFGLWLAFVSALGYYHVSRGTAFTEAFYESAVESAVNLREKVAGAVLDKDVMLMNAALNELGKNRELEYGVIRDFEGGVLAHTDPTQINGTPAPLTGCLPALDAKKVRADKCEGGDHDGTVHFSTDIFYSSLKIGTLVFGVRSAGLDARLSGLRLKSISAFCFSILVFGGLLFISDRFYADQVAKKLSLVGEDSVIGPYVLKDKLATGGMAELFIAVQIRDDGFQKKVVVKRILSHLAGDPDFIGMFIREARLAALLTHPNIVQIYDFRKVDGAYIIAMEYVDGKNLQEIMAVVQKALPVDLCIHLIQKIAKGLHYSHSLTHEKTGEPMNLVHRDVSPQNMLLSRQGEVKITDFGISKAATEPNMTQAGVIKGKLSYLSPEQVLGKELDGRADIYALGLIFYEILSGKRLFRFNNDLDAIRTIPEAVIPPIRELRPEIPEELNRIVMKCLEKDKDVRYRDAGGIDRDLQELKRQMGIAYDETDLAAFVEEVLSSE